MYFLLQKCAKRDDTNVEKNIFYPPPPGGPPEGVPRGPKGRKLTKIELIRQRFLIFVYILLQKGGKKYDTNVEKNIF